jgi:hypothetical protein
MLPPFFSAVGVRANSYTIKKWEVVGVSANIPSGRIEKKSEQIGSLWVLL